MADRCKYQKLQYQVSYNNGSTWENVTPIQVKKGDVIEYMSRDCSEVETLYRWVDLEGTYLCDGNNKYTRQIQEESYDNGISWYTSYPTVYQQGTFVGVDEEYCCDKFVGHYADPQGSPSCPSWYKWNGFECVYVDPLKVVKCNGSNVLTRNETSYYIGDYELISCEIGSSVSTIGEKAFYDCHSLSSVTIPSSVTSIGLWAFQYCRGLTNITIENGLTSIAEAAFEYCRSLTSVTLPSSITSIGYEAFRNCTGLTSITILATTPPTLAYNQAFSDTNNCPIYVPCDSLPLYKGDSNWGRYCDRIYPIQPCTSPTPTGATKFYATYQDGFAYFKYCDSNTNLVTADTQAACSNYKSMVNVEIGNCVTNIGTDAFEGYTSLSSLNIPNTVTSIGTRAISSCPSLRTLTIPNSVTSIGDSSFQYCRGLTSITIGTGITSIGNDAFWGCTSLTSVTVLATTPPSLNGSSFDYTSNYLLIYVPCGSVNAYRSASGWRNHASRILGIPPCEEPTPTPTGATKFYATYPNGIPYFVYCDSNSGLTSATTKGGQFGYETIRSAEIGSCITSIGNSAFSGFTSLSSITIPNSVTSIGIQTFSECSSLESIYIPDSVTDVGIRAFEFCGSATSITIGSSVTNIGDYAFIYCRNISSITCLAIVPPAIGQGIFEDAANCPIYVPCESVNAYQTANGWSFYANRIVGIPPCEPTRWYPSGTTCIGYDKWELSVKEISYDGGATWSVVVPEEYSATTLIETNSEDCGYIPPTKFLAHYSDSTSYSVACGSNSGLTTDTTRAHSTSYTAMTEAFIGDCVKAIDGGAFQDCTSLTSINIPDSVTFIGNSGFKGCTSLTSCTIGSGLTYVGNYTFENCTSLRSIDIPNSVTNFYGGAFRNCTSLTNVTIGTGITNITFSSFEKCSSLTSVTIPNSVTEIQTNAFSGCTSLTRITIEATTPPTLGNNALYNTNNCPIYVPSASVNAYKSASGWSAYASRIQAIP